jgi:hypothetical protein
MNSLMYVEEGVWVTYMEMNIDRTWTNGNKRHRIPGKPRKPPVFNVLYHFSCVCGWVEVVNASCQIR